MPTRHQEDHGGIGSQSNDKRISSTAMLRMHRRVWGMGVKPAAGDLGKIEPDLLKYLGRTLDFIFGEGREEPLSQESLRQMRSEVTLMALTLVAALQEAHNTLWMDNLIGSAVVQTTPAPAKPGEPPQAKCKQDQ